jgi:predicted lipoprotein with Yx(FWY)xxD motif
MQSKGSSLAMRAPTPSAWVVATAAALALFALLAGRAAGTAAPATGPVVSTATANLGHVLVTRSGQTLYLFEKDKNGESACAGRCAQFWPPLIASGKPIAAADVKASLLGTTRRADGRLQVTYNHHPLYTFVKDTKKGQTNGEGIDAFGGEWYVASPAGTAVEKPTSGGGYSGR